MMVLVSYENSGTVRDAFQQAGHDAFSCDLIPGGSPYHFVGDALEVIQDQGPWDLIIAHPPCTALASSGNAHYANSKERAAAVRYVLRLAKICTEAAPRWAIENPVGVLSSQWRKPDQYIQPHQFGHPESKKTGLWLHGLPKLIPTNVLEVPDRGYWENQTPSGQNKVGETTRRAALRSKTYEGIAQAMAEQWGEER